MKERLGVYFEGVQDPRSARNQKHSFITLVGTTLLANLSGFDSFSGIADYAESHGEALSVYFDFPNGTPSHDTYQRFWDAINPGQFEKAFRVFTESLMSLREGIVSVDGKTIRNSGSSRPLHIVSAWCEANQLVLAREKVKAKSNEITAIPELLRLLDLHNRVVTIDAMGAQRNICEQIMEQGGDYVIALKGNQGTLHGDIRTYFQEGLVRQECLNFTEYDKGHGRIEKRKAFADDHIDWLRERHKWPGLQSIGMVESTVIRSEKETHETRYYISSLEADAERLNKIARAHWGIENKLHWRLDVVFNEDKGCLRNDNAAENMDILRKWALNLLQKAKTKPDQSIKSIMRKNAMSLKHCLSCVNKILHA